MKHLGRKGEFKRAIILRVLLITLCLGLVGGTAMAQEDKATKVILFKDGTSVTGKIVEMNINTVKVQTADGAIVVRKFDDIEAIHDPKDMVKQTYLHFPLHSFDIGVEIFHKDYEEPGLMSESGMMYGVALAYTYHRDVMAKLEFKYAMGQVDYEVDYENVYGYKSYDIDDQEWELRGLIGYDFRTSTNFFITPYFGVGYRYLKSDPDHPVIGTSLKLYERESQYFYSPLGVNFTSLFESGWMFIVSGEVDILWYGSQKSKLSTTDPTYDDLENEQDSGYGLRASLRIQKRFENVSLSIEPFVRYWKIKESDWEQVTRGGIPTPGVYWYEPKNTTTELGCVLAVQF